MAQHDWNLNDLGVHSEWLTASLDAWTKMFNEELGRLNRYLNEHVLRIQKLEEQVEKLTKKRGKGGRGG